jgi:hypothetical protein
MASQSLVRSEIDAGLNLIRALDDADFGVVAALWLYFGDIEKWKLTIAYAGKPEEIEKRYLKAATIISKHREVDPKSLLLDLSRVRIVSKDDPLIRGLAPILHIEGTSEVRFSNNLINGIYVEDALIHRLAA